ncbi:apolipophorin-like [Ylistrum balloti]|uniref:apolipophorin-like n=1 Tax=Ylistrum balloti TaxID=509963 RepID=UPI0029057E8F|nr:apolipophorin-like [Ylistrum balloti]
MQQKLGQKLATQIYLLNDRLLNDSISVLQHFDYVRETALTMTDLIDYKYTAFLRKWSNVITVIDTISSITESNVIMTSEHLSRVIDDLKSTGVIMYDANNGFHETEIYVPIDLESLRSLPNVNFKNYVTGLTSSVESLRETASMVHNILVAGIKSWIPPFTASASISNGVIKTFDGTVYTVEGACNFLLAGDLTDGNFSVVMEVLDKKRTKFVISTQMHTIHLSPRKQVRIDGALIHIPYHSHDIYVTKFGDELIIAGNGFSLKYNRQTESYYFFLSGWYFGKTGGLLGTYDNEPYNDMLMATGDITNNIASFSKTWQLNDHCI